MTTSLISKNVTIRDRRSSMRRVAGLESADHHPRVDRRVHVELRDRALVASTDEHRVLGTERRTKHGERIVEALVQRRRRREHRRIGELEVGGHRSGAKR